LTPDIGQLFASSQTQIYVAVDAVLIIGSANACFCELFNSGKSCTGLALESFLPPEVKEKLLPLPSDQSIHKPLSFISINHGIIPLECHIIPQPDAGYIIVGGLNLLPLDHTLRKLSKLNQEMLNLSRDLNRKNRELSQARDEIKVLSGIIPICMHCKEIRDDEGYWSQLEIYISKHSEAEFSHGLCNKCLEKYYPKDDEGLPTG